METAGQRFFMLTCGPQRRWDPEATHFVRVHNLKLIVTAIEDSVLRQQVLYKHLCVSEVFIFLEVPALNSGVTLVLPKRGDHKPTPGSSLRGIVMKVNA